MKQNITVALLSQHTHRDEWMNDPKSSISGTIFRRKSRQLFLIKCKKQMTRKNNKSESNQNRNNATRWLPSSSQFSHKAWQWGEDYEGKRINASTVCNRSLNIFKSKNVNDKRHAQGHLKCGKEVKHKTEYQNASKAEIDNRKYPSYDEQHIDCHEEGRASFGEAVR